MPFQPPVQVTEENFGKSDYADLVTFIQEKVAHLDRRLQSFRTERLPEYIRFYKGKPKNKEVDWPWPGAANLVVQLVGTFSDELLARVMGGIYMYDPLWSAKISGDTPDKEGEELKQVLQNFMMDMAYKQTELDLYRVESLAFHSAIKYGTGIIYSPYEYEEEERMVYIGGGETASSKPVGHFETFVKKDGPKPELIPLNRFGFEPNNPTLSSMKLFYHIEVLDYWDVLNLKMRSLISMRRMWRIS